ncbi:extensin-like domain-containing protein [Oryzibacter oryziterrae]|uniref:extensin-like domain-containing protein n=1 Tax=Oryzibacter oryziterrae TaxID=2766474 RepID=UPI001F17CD6E|nr:extensin family protein [Oryzibacter oryziterrae]
MKPSRFASGLLVLVYPALLVGCGMFDFEEREPWRAQAEAACYARGLVKLTTLIKEIGPIEGKGICGIDRPLKVAALEDGTVSLGNRALVMSCPMTAALEQWVQTSVMPAAYAHYGSPVVEIKNFGTYNCRTRNSVPGARLSEHAFANAFDFAGVTLANGYTVTVKKGWRGNETDRAFLREIDAGACGPFTTVLGPGSDGMHEDHFHLDLAHHNAQGTYRYCKPKPNVTPSAMVASNVPMAPMEIPKDEQVWPKVLPQSIEAADRQPPLGGQGASGFDQPLPPAPVDQGGYPNQPLVYPAAQQGYPAQSAPVSYPAQPVQQPAAACPPGYICTPVGANSVPPQVGTAPGWNVGAQPVQGYSSGDITGSIGGYSDQ